MKYLAMLLLLVGCATASPKEITDVVVYDKLTINEGMFTGCEMYVRVIATLEFNRHRGFEQVEQVCGAIACQSKEVIPVLEPIQCLEFSTVRRIPTNLENHPGSSEKH